MSEEKEGKNGPDVRLSEVVSSWMSLERIFRCAQLQVIYIFFSFRLRHAHGNVGGAAAAARTPANSHEHEMNAFQESEKN